MISPAQGLVIAIVEIVITVVLIVLIGGWMLWIALWASVVAAGCFATELTRVW